MASPPTISEHVPTDPSAPPTRGRWDRRSIAAVALAFTLLLVAIAVGVFRDDAPPEQVPTPVPTATPEPVDPGRPNFISRQGTQLLLNGRPYRFVGYNSFVMTGCGRTEERLDDQQRDEFFASLRPHSVVRVPFAPGTDLAAFDKIVASAREHGHRLIPILTDALGHCGDTKKDPAWYADGFRGEYLTWIRTVVPIYRDEPTIGMWELINEPGGTDAESLRAFFDEAGGLVHELAPDHLVSSGTLQPEGYGGTDVFTYLSDSPGIDVISVHEYDADASASVHAQDAVETAQEIDKPILIGEWGIEAGGEAEVASGESEDCITREERAAMAEAKLRDYLSIPEVAGMLVWSFTNEDSGTCRLNTFDGDPLMDVIRTIEIPRPQQD